MVLIISLLILLGHLGTSLLPAGTQETGKREQPAGCPVPALLGPLVGKIGPNYLTVA